MVDQQIRLLRTAGFVIENIYRSKTQSILNNQLFSSYKLLIKNTLDKYLYKYDNKICTHEIVLQLSIFYIDIDL